MGLPTQCLGWLICISGSRRLRSARGQGRGGGGEARPCRKVKPSRPSRPSTPPQAGTTGCELPEAGLVPLPAQHSAAPRTPISPGSPSGEDDSLQALGTPDPRASTPSEELPRTPHGLARWGSPETPAPAPEEGSLCSQPHGERRAGSRGGRPGLGRGRPPVRRQGSRPHVGGRGRGRGQPGGQASPVGHSHRNSLTLSRQRPFCRQGLLAHSSRFTSQWMPS